MLNKSICPDVSGFLLKDARAVLEESGIRVNKITETSPPKAVKGEVDDNFRVIRVMEYNGKTCDLLVCKPL